MYRIRTPDYSKRDQAKRWALPDRVFFACGACHILAYAVLQRYGAPGRGALWIRSRSGRHGHIVVADARWVFDYHGCHDRERYLAHTFVKARRWWPEWDADLVALPAEVLISEPLSRQYEGLWLREPGQFLHDACRVLSRSWIAWTTSAEDRVCLTVAFRVWSEAAAGQEAKMGLWRTGSFGLGMGVALGLSPVAASAETCAGLWYSRNEIYKAQGYCFRTARAIRAFGNAGCRYDDIEEVPLSAQQHRIIADIVEEERMQGCRD